MKVGNKENGQNHEYELPFDVSSSIPFTNSKVFKFPSALPTSKTNDAILYNHQKDISDFENEPIEVVFGSNSDSCDVLVSGFSSYVEIQRVTKKSEFPTYTRVPGKDPTCNEDGYKPCYSTTDGSNVTYYSAPGEVFGNQTSYETWELNKGKIPADGNHTYELIDKDFDPEKGIFIFKFKLSKTSLTAFT